MKQRQKMFTLAAAFATSGVLATAMLAGDPAPPQVSVADVNPGTSVERDLCLSVSLAPGAASECGDLRLAHALPAVRTLNRARAPVLLYNSQHASPHPIVAAHVTLPSGKDGLSRVVATLKVNGTPRGQGVWKGSAWPGGGPVRIAVGYDAASDSTGPYRYTLEVRAHYGDTMLADTARGELVVVNRRESVFGAGWWLAGLERLVMDPFGKPVLWVGGDGSTRRYTNARGDSVWGTPSLDRPDSIKKTATGWERILGGGVKVEFDATGRHVATVNRLTHRTEFRYDSAGRVDTVSIPLAQRGFSFHYAADGKLERAESPSAGNEPRVTHLHRTGPRVDSIGDPDSTTIHFGYADASRALVPTSRTNRLGVPTRFRYDAAGRVASALINPNGTDSILTRLRAIESLGLAVDGAGALDTARAYALIDGPRSDVGDSTKLWLDRWGAPRRVIDALGRETVLARGDARFPALVTRMELPARADGTRRVSVMAYDRRGNAKESTDSSTFRENADGTRRYATTRYEYDDPRWPDFATRIVPPMEDSTVIGYHADGSRAWQQDARGEMSRVEFFYGAHGAYSHGRTPSQRAAGGAADSVEYDALGNVYRTRTPGGTWTTYHKDRLGRDTLVLTPIDSLDLRHQEQRIRYDAAGRVIRTVSYGPAVRYTLGGLAGMETVPAETLFVYTFYNREGQTDSVARRSGPDPGRVGTITTRWRYDRAGRRVAEIAPGSGLVSWTVSERVCEDEADLSTCRNVTRDTSAMVEYVDSTTYDAAGNVVAAHSRRGHTITTRYDALNRPLERVTPEVRYSRLTMQVPGESWTFPRFQQETDGRFTGTANSEGGVVIPADTARFEYDEVGNVTAANNREARISRTYNLNGTLRSETQRLRTYAGQDTTLHAYTLAYTYDLNGRRTSLRHPDPLLPAPGDSVVRYGYATHGPLERVTDLAGLAFTYAYNADGQLDRKVGIYTEDFRYDVEGRLRERLETGVADTLHHDLYTYDRRGKPVTVATRPGPVRNGYSGLGSLAGSSSVNADGSEHWERYRLDAMANQVERTLSSGGVAGDAVLTFQHEPGTGRMVRRGGTATSGEDSTTYDRGGNRAAFLAGTVLGTSNVIYERTAYYYGADERLRVLDRRTCMGEYIHEYTCDLRKATPYDKRATFEEYRYDALGRRVLMRTRSNWACALYCMNALQRFVWDGDQMLHEISAPDVPNGYGEGPESDDATGRYTEGFFPYGRVAYTHGLGIDDPLSLVRTGYSDTIPEPVHVVPFANWSGKYDGGTGRRCVLIGTATRQVREVVWGPGEEPKMPSEEQEVWHCVQIEWPAKVLWNSYDRRTTWTGPVSWMGSLIQHGRDPSGQLYRRNRYYDPSTGRFTQEDPIGLAGGINLYGFANGDPVTYSDPYGLAAECPTCENEAMLDIQVQGVEQRSGRDVAVLSAVGVGSAVLGFAVLKVGAVGAAKLAPTLAGRAKDIHGALSAATQRRTTTAVGRVVTRSGSSETWVASSERVLRPAQRAALRAGERAVSGTGHAEATIINTARAEGATVEAIAASRPVCAACAQMMREVGARFGSILKQ